MFDPVQTPPEPHYPPKTKSQIQISKFKFQNSIFKIQFSKFNFQNLIFQNLIFKKIKKSIFKNSYF